MKRRELISHLKRNGCFLLREGGKHSIYVNNATRAVATVPRHNEIDENLARRICKDIGIEKK